MYKYTFDVNRRGTQFTIEGLHRGDNGLRTMEFCFSSGGESFPLPEDCIATLYAVLPCGTKIFDSCEVVSDTVVYSLKGSDSGASLTSSVGKALCEIRITAADGKIITSPKFTVTVDEILQDDSAIEAQDSFSALTDALSRVLEAEEGLESKVDKIEGAEGNVVVFGSGGAIADSGIASSKVASNYVFIYDETKEHNDHNRALATQLRSDLENGKKVSVFIDDTANVFPAALGQNVNYIEVIAYDNITAYKIKCYTYSNNVTYAYTDTYSTSGNFNESSSIPASQKLTAEWVKQLIDNTIVEGAW